MIPFITGNIEAIKLALVGLAPIIIYLIVASMVDYKKSKKAVLVGFVFALIVFGFLFFYLQLLI